MKIYCKFLILLVVVSILVTAFILYRYRAEEITAPPSGFDVTEIYKGEWVPGVTYEVENLASDIRRVCVKTPSSNLDCTYFDYWTNNRTGEWERLQRTPGDAEGSNYCEYYEEWKVGKGMPCVRLTGSPEESFVNY